MRVLVFFGGAMLESRGTPSRVRNLTSALAALPTIELLAITRDPTGRVAEAMAVPHRDAGTANQRGDRLRRAVTEFRPHLVWGHTHKALIELSSLRSDCSSALLVADLHGHAAVEALEATAKPPIKRLLQFIRWRIDEPRLLRQVDALTVVSHPLRRHLRRFPKPLEVVWGGVDTKHFHPLPPAANPKLRISYAGNFRPYQGVRTLLEAARILCSEGVELQLELIGDASSLEAGDRKLVDGLGETVHLHPPVAYDGVPALLADADVLVIPRPDHGSARYGFPSKLPEYLATGRPVVATAVGDQARVLTHMENGLLVEPGDPSALAAALKQLRSRELRDRLGAAGRATAERSLTWQAIARQAADFFTSLTAARQEASSGNA